MILRPYQEKGVADIRRAFQNGAQSVCYSLPTGGGKTYVFSYVAEQAAAQGNRVGILVHRDALLRQASDSLTTCGISHGIIAPGHSPTKDLVQVASVQTLARRLDRHEFDLLIPDEGHHATAGTWLKIVARMPEAHILGVTATPCRADGRGLDEIYETLVIGPSIGELIDLGYLVEPVVYAPPTRIDLSAVRTRLGDYDKTQLHTTMDTPKITGDAVEHYRRHANGIPAVAFCVSIKHAEDVAADFCAAGFKAASINGKMPVEQIRDTTAGLTDGRVQVLASCDLISEGFDAPAVGCAILLRPTQSEGLYIQQVGRALRPAPGKQKAIILDHSGNCFKHGMPDEDRAWTLEGRKKRSKMPQDAAVAVRQCPRCFACHKPALACPACGFAYPIEARQIDQVAGDLEKIDPSAVAAARRAKRAEVGRARSLDDLRAIAARRGYKPAWASIMWQQRGGGR